MMKKKKDEKKKKEASESWDKARHKRYSCNF